MHRIKTVAKSSFRSSSVDKFELIVLVGIYWGAMSCHSWGVTLLVGGRWYRDCSICHGYPADRWPRISRARPAPTPPPPPCSPPPPPSPCSPQSSFFSTLLSYTSSSFSFSLLPSTSSSSPCPPQSSSFSTWALQLLKQVWFILIRSSSHPIPISIWNTWLRFWCSAKIIQKRWKGYFQNSYLWRLVNLPSNLLQSN